MHTVANTRIAKPRMMLDAYMREAAEALAARQMELGQRIRKARRDKNWKQKHLAAAVHVEPMTVSRWETGRHAPDLDTLELVAEATEKPLSFFLDPPATAQAPNVADRLTAIESEIRELRQVLEALATHVRQRGAAAL